MSYKITIERTAEVVRKEEPGWVVIERRPWTDGELQEKASRAYGDTYKELLEREPLKEVRGYPPAREVTKIESATILQQTVEDLDLAAVIKAINKL